MMALAIILGYVLMIWITALILGIWSWDNEMDEFEWIMASFWPLIVSTLIVVGIGCFFSWLWGFMPWKPQIEETMMKLCIVFKPFKIGTMIRGWIQRKKDEKTLKKVTEEGRERNNESIGNGRGV